MKSFVHEIREQRQKSQRPSEVACWMATAKVEHDKLMSEMTERATAFESRAPVFNHECLGNVKPEARHLRDEHTKQSCNKAVQRP